MTTMPRNAVTRHSHGFITRDGVTPAEFRAIGHGEIAKYPSVEVLSTRIRAVNRQGRRGKTAFELVAEDGETFQSGNVILAAGLRETLPAVEESIATMARACSTVLIVMVGSCEISRWSLSPKARGQLPICPK